MRCDSRSRSSASRSTAWPIMSLALLMWLSPGRSRGCTGGSDGALAAPRSDYSIAASGHAGQRVAPCPFGHATAGVAGARVRRIMGRAVRGPDSADGEGGPMELISRMMDGSISYDASPGLEPSSSGPGVSQDDRIERLERVPLFAGCTRRQLKAIARITDVFDAPPGTVLTRSGDPGNEFFLIVEGSARVDVSARKSSRLRAGDFFGEMSLLDGEPRSATVVAETLIRLLVINRKNFTRLLGDVPGMMQNLLVVLSRRVRQAERALTS